MICSFFYREYIPLFPTNHQYVVEVSPVPGDETKIMEARLEGCRNPFRHILEEVCPATMRIKP